MIQQMRSAPRVDSPSSLAHRLLEALNLLCEAQDAAHAEQCEIWQFAVEIDQLRNLGLSHTDLRRLLCCGYLAHARERTTVSAYQRIFQPLRTLVLPKRTCFVLTEKGREVVSEYAAEKCAKVVGPSGNPTEVPRSLPKIPRWDSESRQLWWQDWLIKRFHRPAVNQELVLTALEEEGWPTRIDDPLPPTGGIDPKVRLHDTIKALNRHHLHRIIHFNGDGKGWGVQWIMVKQG